MSSSDPTRRVPKKLGESDEFWRGYTLDDLLVGGMPFILAVLLTAYVLPPNLRYVGYVLAVIGLIVGAVAVYVTPDYLTASEWVSTYFHHLRRPTESEHVRYDFGSAREQRDFPESRFYELDERTQELTDVERVHVDRDAVERFDNAFVGAVRVEPANMALATDRRWRDNVAAFADFFNNSVEWAVQLYSTTTEFPVDDYLRRRERRLDDDDVAGNPVFRRLIEEWLDWYPRELEARGTNIREHYVVVPVRRDEVRSADGGGGVLDSLADLPLVGGVFGALSSGDGMTEDEIRARALNELDERLRMVENEGIQNLDGCRAHRVDSDELVRLLAEFWEGESADHVEEGAVRENPVVAGEYDAEREREEDGDADEDDGVTDEPTEDTSLFASFFGGDGGAEEEDKEDVAEGNVTDDVAETHKALIAPSEAVFERNAAKLGQRWTKTIWAEGYPDQPTNG
ncbi:MAG: hypothetical protein ACI9QA_000959, partial [Methanobacteriota archaeon]